MILWARRVDDPNRWHPPLEAMSQGSGIAVIDDVAIFTHIYRPHICPAKFANPEVPNAVEIAKEEQKARYDDYRDRDRGRKATEYRMHEAGPEVSGRVAAMIDCPKCKVSAGEFCVNIPKAAKGEKEYVKWPHHPRFAEAETLMENNTDTAATTKEK